jgi:hypothetical protein
MNRKQLLIPLLLLLFIVLLSAGVRSVAPTAGNPGAAGATRRAPVGATPTPTPPAGSARAVARSLAAVERAFNAGDVQRLCRPGALVDPAVIREQNAASGGCESELETLMANEPPLRLAVRRFAPRPDLVTANVVTASGDAVAVDFVRQGTRWLLSFSDGEDPMQALAAGA